MNTLIRVPSWRQPHNTLRPLDRTLTVNSNARRQQILIVARIDIHTQGRACVHAKIENQAAVDCYRNMRKLETELLSVKCLCVSVVQVKVLQWASSRSTFTYLPLMHTYSHNTNLLVMHTCAQHTNPKPSKNFIMRCGSPPLK